jgi:hypothetical protein
VIRDGRGVGSGNDIARSSRIGRYSRSGWGTCAQARTRTRTRTGTDLAGVGRATFKNHHVVRPGAYR